MGCLPHKNKRNLDKYLRHTEVLPVKRVMAPVVLHYKIISGNEFPSACGHLADVTVLECIIQV
jgi:hypothetical protein